MTSNPYSPFPEIPRPPFPSGFDRPGPTFPRFASSTSSDVQSELDRMRDDAMRRMHEHLGDHVPNRAYRSAPSLGSSSESPAEPAPSEPPSAESADQADDAEADPADPATSRIIPPGRPAWVEQAPEWEDEHTYAVAVSSGPYSRGTECRRELDKEIDLAIAEFANELLDEPQAARMLGSDLDELKEMVVVETYQEELSSTVGPMQQWHSLLRFGEDAQMKIYEFWQAQLQVSRIVYIGAGFFGLLGLLSVFYVGLSLTGEGSRISPWVVSAGTVVALGSLLVVAVIFVRAFPML